MIPMSLISSVVPEGPATVPVELPELLELLVLMAGAPPKETCRSLNPEEDAVFMVKRHKVKNKNFITVILI
jgi:hypothetical protein